MSMNFGTLLAVLLGFGAGHYAFAAGGSRAGGGVHGCDEDVCCAATRGSGTERPRPASRDMQQLQTVLLIRAE
jgi:hypothetical protein